MKAVVYRKFGPPEVLETVNRETPVPMEDELLIHIKAIAVTAGDIRGRSLKGMSGLFWLPARLMFGFLKPKNPILGSYFSGIVGETGKQVTAFKSGERVVGFRMTGAYAETIAQKEHSVIVKLPQGIGYQAAAVAPFGLLTANACLKGTDLSPQSKMLVNGASGGVGLAVVQLAKAMGAEVTGTCSPGKMELVKAAGADHVIDYRSQSIDARKVAYDIIVDTSGQLSFSKASPLLTPKGQLHLVDFRSIALLQMLWTSWFGKQKVKCHVVNDTVQGLEFVKTMILEGKYKPFIERVYPLDQLAQAHRHFESGNKLGNLVVEIR